MKNPIYFYIKDTGEITHTKAGNTQPLAVKDYPANYPAILEVGYGPINPKEVYIDPNTGIQRPRPAFDIELDKAEFLATEDGSDYITLSGIPVGAKIEVFTDTAFLFEVIAEDTFWEFDTELVETYYIRITHFPYIGNARYIANAI